MAHRRAKLTPLGRTLLVERIAMMGWSVSAAATSVGVSRPTAYEIDDGKREVTIAKVRHRSDVYKG